MRGRRGLAVGGGLEGEGRGWRRVVVLVGDE